LVRGPEFAVETLSGVSEVRVEDPGGPEARVTVRMPPARLAPEAVPARFEGENALGVPLRVGDEVLTVYSLSTGTAHTVIFERPNDGRFEVLSPKIEHHPVFPERTSIMWADVAGADRVLVRIWERGVGETLACGTGAAATAVAAHLSGHTGSCVEVRSKGGVLLVEVAEDLSLHLTGPARFVFEGTWTGPRVDTGSR
jgi:diaminopimelate epimerase